MRSLIRIIAVGSLLVGVTPATHAAAQASDQWIGTWKANIAKSKFTPGPGPKSITVTIAKAENGMTFTAKNESADGKWTTTSYTAMLDGMDAPVTGAADFDMVSVKMLDPMTRHMVRKKGGKEVQTVHSVLAKDGKQFTSSMKGVNGKGEPVESVIVFEKQ